MTMTTKLLNNAMISKNGSVTGICAHDLSEQSKTRSPKNQQIVTFGATYEIVIEI